MRELSSHPTAEDRGQRTPAGARSQSPDLGASVDKQALKAVVTGMPSEPPQRAVHTVTQPYSRPEKPRGCGAASGPRRT